MSDSMGEKVGEKASATVQCVYFGEEKPALKRPPFPGPAGEAIFTTISAEAWQLWLQHQTRLINEKRLSVLAPETQSYLAEQRGKFLAKEGADAAEGFVPK